MNVSECLGGRRSVREYKDTPVKKEDLELLIELGTKAATGSNKQPWGFLVIDDPAEIDALSEQIKAYLHEHIDEHQHLGQYAKWLTNPKFHVFNKAKTVLLIYGDESSYYYVKDCTLAASNIMLAAFDMGIGSCWIGFAEYMLDTPAFKEKHGVPKQYHLVCPLSMGYMLEQPKPPTRKAPVLFGAK